MYGGVSLFIYVVLLAYLCAPNVLVRKSWRSEDMQSFLHAIVFWIVLIISVVLLVFTQTFIVTTTTMTTTDATTNPSFYGKGTVTGTGASGTASGTGTSAGRDSSGSGNAAAAPPTPTFPRLDTPSWSWPMPSITYSPPTLPTSTALPSFLPPPTARLSSSEWLAPSPALAPAQAPAPAYAPASYAPPGAPAPCVQQECLPLPPLRPMESRGAPAPSSQSAGGDGDSATTNDIAKVLNIYNERYPSNAVSTNQWLQYLKPFPQPIVHKLSVVLQRNMSNVNFLIPTMQRINEFQTARSPQEVVQNYILAL